jgi:hypothetical protein
MLPEERARAGGAGEVGHIKAVPSYLRSPSQIQHRAVKFEAWPDGTRPAGWHHHEQYGAVRIWAPRRAYRNVEKAIAALDLEARPYGDDEVSVLQAAVEKFYGFRPTLRYIRMALLGREGGSS